MKLIRYTILSFFLLTPFFPNITLFVHAQTSPTGVNCSNITLSNYSSCCVISSTMATIPNQAGCTAYDNGQQTTNTSYTIGSITYSGTCADKKDNDVNGLADDQDPKCRTNYGFCEIMNAQCQRQVNLYASSATRNRFNPNASINTNGKTFSGISITGVGGAIASCANVGKRALKGIQSLKGKVGGITGKFLSQQVVPTYDEKTKLELANLNNTQQCLDGIAFSLAKNMLGQITNKTLNWVNTGFGGNPLYVRDQDSYLKSIGNEKIAMFLEQTPASNPIFGGALRSIITSQLTGKKATVNMQQNTPQAIKYNEFMGDFTQGGWAQWLNTTQIDSNNPVGAFFETVDSLDNSIKTAQQNTREELTRNGGFLDLRKCVEWENNGQIASGNNGLSGEPRCLRWETVTPGSTISSQVAFTLNSPTRQLEQADEINEVLGSYFDKLLNSLFSKGLGSLRSNKGLDGAGGFSGAGANTVIGSNGQSLSGGNGFGYSLNASGYGSGDFDISRPQQLRAILQAQYNFINRARDSQIVMNRLVPRMGELDYCMPGPNPTFLVGAEENAAILNATWQASIEKLIQLSQSTGANPRMTTFTMPVAKLMDKVDEAAKTVRPRSTYPSSYSTPTRPTIDEFLALLQGAYEKLAQDTQASYSMDAIANTFASVGTTAGEQAYLRGFAKTAYKKTSQLVGYSQAIGEMNDQYDESISNAEDSIAQLEEIRAEAEEIVAKAKARYIADRKALGNPVDLACINTAYKIDTSPIIGIVRNESDTPQPVVLQSAAAAAAFYNDL